MPPVDYNDSTWERVPIQPMKSLDSWDYLTTKDKGLFVIEPQAFVFRGFNHTTQHDRD